MLLKSLLFSVISLTLLINISSAQDNTKTEAKVNFEVDYIKVDIKDEFNIFFVVGHDTIRPEIKADKIIFDNSLIKDSTYLLVVFKYKKYCLKYSNIYSNLIKGLKSFDFWYDNRPYSKNHLEGISRLKTKYIYGWHFYGVGGCGAGHRISRQYKIFDIF